mmetsp:Transcript_36390/g.58400  ORF Transcript_36390/g.58400 Transcript_36390/m.58400 type:complete len:284 (-) Transcript_36390:911-1762(-)
MRLLYQLGHMASCNRNHNCPVASDLFPSLPFAKPRPIPTTCQVLLANHSRKQHLSYSLGFHFPNRIQRFAFPGGPFMAKAMPYECIPGLQGAAWTEAKSIKFRRCPYAVETMYAVVLCTTSGLKTLSNRLEGSSPWIASIPQPVGLPAPLDYIKTRCTTRSADCCCRIVYLLADTFPSEANHSIRQRTPIPKRFASHHRCTSRHSRPPSSLSIQDPAFSKVLATSPRVGNSGPRDLATLVGTLIERILAVCCRIAPRASVACPTRLPKCKEQVFLGVFSLQSP